MKRIKNLLRPSPAMLVAIVALVAALGGGAVAGVAVTALNKKEKKQVTKIAKQQGKKQATKQINKREPGLNVNSARSADNAKAVNNQTIVPINHRSNDVTNATLASLNGITMRVSCENGFEDINAVTTVPDSEISAISNDASSTTGNADDLVGAYEDEFNPGVTFNPSSDATTTTERQYTLIYSAADGRNVTATFVTEDDHGASNCVVSGYAIG